MWILKGEGKSVVVRDIWLVRILLGSWLSIGLIDEEGVICLRVACLNIGCSFSSVESDGKLTGKTLNLDSSCSLCLLHIYEGPKPYLSHLRINLSQRAGLFYENSTKY
jgi:hypothetical protein